MYVSASGHDFALGTPSIKFTEGSSKMVFTATPAEGGPCTATPRRKMDRILSPSSAMKVKRCVERLIHLSVNYFCK